MLSAMLDLSFHLLLLLLFPIVAALGLEPVSVPITGLRLVLQNANSWLSNCWRSANKYVIWSRKADDKKSFWAVAGVFTTNSQTNINNYRLTTAITAWNKPEIIKPE